MKKVTIALSLVLVLAFSTIGAAGARPIFPDVTSTADGYYTWDADMIDLEEVSETGAGVYVAVLDTGLVPNWQDYFPEERVATDLGTGFEQSVSFKAGNDQCGLGVTVGALRQTTWVGSRGSSHGTHVASTILGYYYRSNSDAAQGFALPPIVVRGIAPDVTIIPVKVLADYQVPALPKCTNPGPTPAQNVVFGTDEMVAAGIDYVTDLKVSGALGDSPVVINMSLGSGTLADIEKAAIDRAIAEGVIVVAAAGNDGEAGMHYPGAYPPVISAGSAGWVGEWLKPGTAVDPANRYRMWWLKDDEELTPPLLPNTGDVHDPTRVEDVYVSDFSSRELTGEGQELDVMAPGSWVRGPFPGDSNYAHLPWWSKGISDLVNGKLGNFFYVGGTSMATPHVASAAALLLEKDPTLTQSQIEGILKSTTLKLPKEGSRTILDNTVVATVTWDTTCGEGADAQVCDPVGEGLIQVDDAINSLP